jgi:centromere protein C
LPGAIDNSVSVAFYVAMAKGKRSTQLPTQRAARGTRSSVIVPDNDSSDIEEFFDNARSPEAVLGNDPSRRSPRSSSKVEPAVAVGRPARASKQILRLSLPGQQQDDYDSHVPAGKYRPDLLGSPSELSKVSTLPPTPAITLRSDEVEITRQALAARDEQEKPIDADLVDFSAPADDDVGGDDLAPPAVDDDDDEFPEEPQIADSMVDESFQDRKPAARASLPDTDSEDDDKEGHGFAIAQNEAQEAAAETADKKKMKRVSIASDDKTPVPKNRGKKGQRVPIFSPRGIPIGNRMYQRIPIVEPSPVDAGDLRRSRRSKQKPLEFWRNERVEYGPADDDNFVEEIGDMPLPKAVMRAQDTPYRKRKDAGKSKTAHTKNEKAKRRASAASASDRDDDVAFDYSKLQKKYKGNLIESETANVWDDGIDELSDLSRCSGSTQLLALLRFLSCSSCISIFLAYRGGCVCCEYGGCRFATLRYADPRRR